MKVLIAEDNLLFQEKLTHVLAPHYEIVLANDGNEAWAALQGDDAPRIAILDWVMPGLGGPEICRKVRACASLSSMYLIILTAKNSEADIVAGLRAGADDYITKPPSADELRGRMKVGREVLALRDAVKEQSDSYERSSGKRSSSVVDSNNQSVFRQTTQIEKLPVLHPAANHRRVPDALGRSHQPMNHLFNIRHGRNS